MFTGKSPPTAASPLTTGSLALGFEPGQAAVSPDESGQGTKSLRDSSLRRALNGWAGNQLREE